MFIEFPKVSGVVVEDMEEIVIPEMMTIEEEYERKKIEDLQTYIRQEMEAHITDLERFREKRIAITVGSRGIPHLLAMVRTICDQLKLWGAWPFVISAMGSHGGGTIEGQLEVLAGYHITEENIGVPVLATMDVVQYGKLSNGVPLYCNQLAWEADGIILFNKVKPHTDFRGEHESGLAKMISIGLANHKGASAFHGAGVSQFPKMIPEAADCFLSKRKLTIGIGVVQNAYDNICAIGVAEQQGILERDKDLLALAKEKIGKLKFNQCDILIIDQIGKNISGCGADPNVTGRPTAINPKGFSDILKTDLIVVLRLTPESHHNGCGIGIADITTRACLNEIDWGYTWTNHINSLELHCSKIPCYANSDEEAIRFAIRSLPAEKREHPKIARIRSTLEISEVQVSPALYADMREAEGVRVIALPRKLAFDSMGNLM